MMERSLSVMILSRFLHRLNIATTTIPTTQSWFICLILLLAYALISLPLGFRFRFLTLEIIQDWRIIIAAMTSSLFTPAISEEIFFRVLLLPHPTETTTFLSLIFWISLSLVIFIIYHPLNAMSFFPAGLKTFMNPVFLILAALLGLICTISYLQSGSLWVPIFIHWLVVWVWLLVLGGYHQLKIENH